MPSTRCPQAIAMCDELENVKRYRETRFDATLFLGRIYAMTGEYIKAEETFGEAEKKSIRFAV